MKKYFYNLILPTYEVILHCTHHYTRMFRCFPPATDEHLQIIRICFDFFLFSCFAYFQKKSSAVSSLRGTNIVISSYSRFIIFVHLVDWIEQEWSGISLRNIDFSTSSCPHTPIQESIVSFAISIFLSRTVTVVITLGTTGVIQNQQK
jgi:hypothetical protein